MPPLKPEVAVIKSEIWVFISGAYEILTVTQARALIRYLQAAEAKVRRAEKRAKRAAKKAAP